MAESEKLEMLTRRRPGLVSPRRRRATATNPRRKVRKSSHPARLVGKHRIVGFPRLAQFPIQRRHLQRAQTDCFRIRQKLAAPR